MKEKIYESPDKGKTIFERTAGSLDRYPVAIKDQEYAGITRKSKLYSRLKKELCRVKLFYRLMKDE